MREQRSMCEWAANGQRQERRGVPPEVVKLVTVVRHGDLVHLLSVRV